MCVCVFGVGCVEVFFDVVEFCGFEECIYDGVCDGVFVGVFG